jgi:hypothetical protein
VLEGRGKGRGRLSEVVGLGGFWGLAVEVVWVLESAIFWVIVD